MKYDMRSGFEICHICEAEKPDPAQPEPRGSEALATKVLYLAKSMNQSNIWALRNEIMELCEEAAATAERTPDWFPNEGDRQYWLEKNCRDVPRPAPPQPEAPEKEKR
jgi:hypothetical protein